MEIDGPRKLPGLDLAGVGPAMMEHGHVTAEEDVLPSYEQAIHDTVPSYPCPGPVSNRITSGRHSSAVSSSSPPPHHPRHNHDHSYRHHHSHHHQYASDRRPIRLTLQVRRPSMLRGPFHDMPPGDVLCQHTDLAWLGRTTLLPRARQSFLDRARDRFGLPGPSPAVQFFAVLMLQRRGEGRGGDRRRQPSRQHPQLQQGRRGRGHDRPVVVTEENWGAVVEHLFADGSGDGRDDDDHDDDGDCEDGDRGEAGRRRDGRDGSELIFMLSMVPRDSVGTTSGQAALWSKVRRASLAVLGI